MTTVQPMHRFARPGLSTLVSWLRACAVIVCVLVALPGCSTEQPALVPPAMLTAPYDSTSGDALWAVVPVRNESGISFADTALVGDQLVAAAEEVRGVTCLPLNRTLVAMHALEMDAVDSPRKARELARALGVDAVLVATLTAWDPYDPPKIGLAMALYPVEMQDTESFDPRALNRAVRDPTLDVAASHDQPITTASVLLDARNHEVLLHLEDYATGRSDPASALNWRIYTASMELYTRFAAQQAVGRLLEEEWLRLARAATGRER